MKTLLKKKWFVPTATIAAIGIIVALVWAFFYVDYASIKTDNVITPPLEGTRFGMTMEEFCAAMDIAEDELTPAEPFDSSRYFELDEISEEGKNFWSRFDNQYYFKYENSVCGAENYYVDGQPQTLRVVFTNEATYNGKTIPPLLCAVYAEFPLQGSEYQLNSFIDAAKEEHSDQLEPRLTHSKAQLLSYLYSSGLNPKEIEALDVPHMSQKDVTIKKGEIFNSIPFAVVPEQFILNKWYTKDASGMPTGYVVYAQAGYIIYYDWFLNELT